MHKMHICDKIDKYLLSVSRVRYMNEKIYFIVKIAKYLNNI